MPSTLLPVDQKKFYQPVTEAMPEKPSCDPIFFIDAGHVSAKGVVVLRL
jgi:hypothetical protein